TPSTTAPTASKDCAKCSSTREARARSACATARAHGLESSPSFAWFTRARTTPSFQSRDMAGGCFAPLDRRRTAPSPAGPRAVGVFEDPAHAPTPSDADVFRLLSLLCRSRAKVQQGRASTWVDSPVDFSDLSSEYIGILYEGLLDYELRLGTEPMVFLSIGDE